MTRARIRLHRPSTRLARHLARRRRLAERVSATTSLAFLRRLALALPAPSGVTFPEWAAADSSLDDDDASSSVAMRADDPGEPLAPTEAPSPKTARSVETAASVAADMPTLRPSAASVPQRTRTAGATAAAPVTGESSPGAPAPVARPEIAAPPDSALTIPTAVSREDVAADPSVTPRLVQHADAPSLHADALALHSAAAATSVIGAPPNGREERSVGPTAEPRRVPDAGASSAPVPAVAALEPPNARAAAVARFVAGEPRGTDREEWDATSPHAPVTPVTSPPVTAPVAVPSGGDTSPPADVRVEPAVHTLGAATGVTGAEHRVADSIARHPVATTSSRRGRIQEIRPTPSVAQSDRRAGDTSPSSAAAVRRSHEAADSPRARAADLLFQPVDQMDLSPAAWGARLAAHLNTPPAMMPRRQTAPRALAPRRGEMTPRVALPVLAARPMDPPAGTGVPRRAATDDAPVQLSESARRFVKPLTGVDPATVTLWSGRQSRAATASLGADALAVGVETVVLGEAYDGETPRGLGLIAHELAHVARQRSPRFVPPAAAASPDAPEVSASGDEEAIARRVEGRVIAAARVAPIQSAAPPAAPPPSPDPHALLPAGAAAIASDPIWNGLPAPWQPLPSWVAVPEAAARAPATPAVVVPGENPGGSARAAVPSTAPVQRAETGRSIDTATSAAAAPAGGDPAPQAVAPDLDALARQVYAALKRRLHAESRREQLF